MLFRHLLALGSLGSLTVLVSAGCNASASAKTCDFYVRCLPIIAEKTSPNECRWEKDGVGITDGEAKNACTSTFEGAFVGLSADEQRLVSIYIDCFTSNVKSCDDADIQAAEATCASQKDDAQAALNEWGTATLIDLSNDGYAVDCNP